MGSRTGGFEKSNHPQIATSFLGLKGGLHLALILRHTPPQGFLEIRALKRISNGSRMQSSGSRFIPCPAQDQECQRQLSWAESQAARGNEIFVGYNARILKGKSKRDVTLVTACYADLDLHDADVSMALAAAREAPVRPDLIIDSGYGLHLAWFVKATSDKKKWQSAQRAIESYFAEHCADPSVSTDESRVLRLVPFPNLKNGDSRPTKILDHSDRTEALAIETLLSAFESKDSARSRPKLPRKNPNQTIPAGQRNNRLTRLAGQMRRAGFSREGIEAALLIENNKRCRPPLAEPEVRTIATSISRYEPLRKHTATSYEEVAAERIPRFYTAKEIGEAVQEEITWVVRPLIARGVVTEIDGKVKSAGKTTFLTHISKRVVEGGTFMGEPTTKTRVVYLTEEPRRAFREALRRAGLLDCGDLRVMFWHDIYEIDWPNIVEIAVKECERIGASMLVVDTLGQFASIQGDGENSAGEALAAVQPLQIAAARHNLAVVFTRHERKSGGEVGDSGRGSSATGGAVDTIISIRRGDGNSQPNVRVLQALSRFDEIPTKLIVELTDAGYVSHGGETQIAAQNAQSAVLNVAPTTEDAATTLDDFVEATGCKRTVTQNAVKRLVENGELNQVGKGSKGSPRRYWKPAFQNTHHQINAAATSIHKSGGIDRDVATRGAI
jgi:hypothetical protein